MNPGLLEGLYFLLSTLLLLSLSLAGYGPPSETPKPCLSTPKALILCHCNHGFLIRELPDTDLLFTSVTPALGPGPGAVGVC